MSFLSHIYQNKIYDCRWQIKLFMLIQSIFFSLSFIPNADQYLAITVSRVLPPNFYLWTVLTFSVYNNTLVYFLLDLLTVFLVDKFLSSSHNWTELLRFCAIVNLSTAAISVVCLFIGYVITSEFDLLLTKHICGLVAVLGGVTVLSRQMMSEKLLLDFPLGKIRYKHIPFLCVALFCVLFVSGLRNGLSFFMFTCGIMVAWIYLRFFQHHSNGLYGDINDSFTFAGYAIF